MQLCRVGTPLPRTRVHMQGSLTKHTCPHARRGGHLAANPKKIPHTESDSLLRPAVSNSVPPSRASAVHAAASAPRTVSAMASAQSVPKVTPPGLSEEVRPRHAARGLIHHGPSDLFWRLDSGHRYMVISLRRRPDEARNDLIKRL